MERDRAPAARRGAPDRRAGAAAGLAPPDRPGRDRAAPHLAQDRPHRGGRAERRPRAVEPARVRLPAGAAAAGDRARPRPVRVQQRDPADGCPPAVSRRIRGAAALRIHPGVVRGQRAVPPGHPRPARRCRTAALPRHPGHEPGVVAVDRVDEQPQRHADAGDPAGARRDRRLPPQGPRALLGPRRARLPAARPGEPRGCVDRAPPCAGFARSGIARATGPGMPVEPTTVGEAGVEATVEGVPGVWRVDPDALGKPFTGRTALLSPARPARLRPQADGAALGLRLHPRDVQAGEGPQVGLLRAADPASTSVWSGRWM